MVRADFSFFTGWAAVVTAFSVFFYLIMLSFFRFPLLSGALVGATLLLSSPVACAQTVVHGYDFLTVTSIEGQNKNEAKLLLTPAFQGQTDTALIPGSLYSLSKKDIETIAQNTQIINQQISAITTAGWELFQVYQVTPGGSGGTTIPITRYLFRKAKN
jgi:hypothetical protein